jgi:opacity protein-like surface antigen
MRQALLGAVAATALFMGSMQASAADIEVAPEPMGWSWYVSVFGGWSFSADADVEYSGESYDVELEDGLTVGAAVGAHINEWLRGEIELSGNWHDGEVELTTPTATTAEGDVDALFVLANLWFDIPVGDVFRPYVGGGIGFGRLDADLDTAAGTFVDDSDWAFAYQLGAGVAFGFAENIAFDVGYRFKGIANADLETTAGGDAEADYHSHNIIAGVRIGF